MIKKILIAFLSVIALAGITFAFYKFVYLKAPRFNKAGLKVDTFYSQAKVYLDGELAGETPFSSQKLKAGEIILAVDGKYGRFEDKITLEKGTISLVSLKITPLPDLTQSRILWLEKQPGSQAISVLSNVLGVRVELDGEDQGLAPLTIDDIAQGEHEIKFSKDGYEAVSARVDVLADHKVNFKVSLTPLLAAPNPESIKYEGSDLVLISNYTPEQLPSFLSASPETWARGLGFLKESEAEGYSLSFDYLLDYAGTVYDGRGLPLPSFSEVESKEGLKFGYLGRTPEAAALSAKAKESLDSFIKEAFGSLGPQIEILPTGIGFLRVREKASLASKEVGQVTVGDKFRVLEQDNPWYKIEYEKGKEGWVSGDYTKEVVNETLH